MRKIMFVCLGNICRSPMAEYMLKDIVKKQGRSDDFYIESSATSDENVWNGVGSPVYPPAKAKLKSVGISCEDKRAQVLTASHGDIFDLFMCMDDSNVRNAKRILGAKNAHKCVKLLSFVGEEGSVADPWYTGDFEATYRDIGRGLNGLLQTLEE